ncbi:GPW/gp25 family protein [bacterium]|nr:GPW/gp25 family protein [bacterium]
MTLINEIKYVDWQCKLNGIGGVAEGIEDINQCIAIILQTQKGSDPHRPTFGSDIMKYVDYPVNTAKANIIRETIDAINLWETRVKINKTEVEINGSTILIKVEWTLASSKTSGTAEVTL